MPYSVLEREIKKLDAEQQNSVVMFVRFLLSQKTSVTPCVDEGVKARVRRGARYRKGGSASQPQTAKIDFFGSLKEIKPGSMNGVECVESKGKAPKQLKSDDPLAGVGGGKGGNDDFMFDDEFKDELDLGDIDYEGFQDLSFDDGTMF